MKLGVACKMSENDNKCSLKKKKDQSHSKCQETAKQVHIRQQQTHRCLYLHEKKHTHTKMKQIWKVATKRLLNS